jgi:predicted ATPase/class 3 adenylate cyclase/Tfp pilus assembly protein PilF
VPSLPTGTVTFLFTDIEGSTELVQRLGDHRYADVLEEHKRLLRDAFAKGSGQEIETQGDAILVAFPRARDAIAAAVAAQRAFTRYAWPQDVSPRVRMGLHTGEPLSGTFGYVGLDVHRAARICGAGHGGQILLSDVTQALVANDLPAGVSLRDLGEHRLKDLADPQRLFQVTGADLLADFPQLRAIGSVLHHNLPSQLTSFIGREREIADVKAMLASGRLVTLTGVGGSGKTRLALRVGDDLLGERPDGVWLVELASLTDGALVTQAVATALGVPEQLGQALFKTLTDYLRPKSLLLLLDNCEHLLAACAQLTDVLLRGCPNLRILATSREGLGIAGEAQYPVPALPVPDPERLRSTADLVLYESVRLFTERATAVLSTFRITPQNAKPVAQICYHLDGIPLAIELAATRTKALPVEVIAARLDERFRLLTRGSRTSFPRHQTLQAALDWSHALLSERERMLLRRLAVFAGTFRLEAAEQICVGGDIAEGDVLDLVTRLVEKSLVVFAGDGDARYRFLETVREYARARLRDAGEDAEVQRQHWNWYLALAQEAQPELRGPNQAAWLERLEGEHDNLQAALEWASGRREIEQGLRLAVALGRFWELRCYWGEGRTWLERLLAEAGGGVPARARAEGLRWAGVLAREQGDYATARSLIEESVRLFREAGDKHGIADACNSLGNTRSGQGDFEGALVFYEESLALFRELGDRRRVLVALYNLGLMAVRLDSYQVARQNCTEALALARELGDTWGVTYALYIMGEAAERQGDYAEAAAFYSRSLALARELGNRHHIASVLTGLARVAQEQGDHNHAVARYDEALAVCRELGDPWSLAFTLNNFGTLAQAQGDYERAVALHHEALAAGQEIRNEWSMAISLNKLGKTARCQADYKQAIVLQRRGLALSRKVHSKLGICESLEELGNVACAQEESTRAARLFGAAEALRATIGAPLPPSARRDYDRQLAVLRTALGARTAAAWAEGRAMTVEQAVEYALEDAK